VKEDWNYDDDRKAIFVVLDSLFILVRDILTGLIVAAVLNRQVKVDSQLLSSMAFAKLDQDMKALWGIPHGARSLRGT
jgi:hypothetical protein